MECARMNSASISKTTHTNSPVAIVKGTFRSSPVLRVNLPKEEPGKFRELGIPTVLDRLVQQAIAQILERHYDWEYPIKKRPNV